MSPLMRPLPEATMEKKDFFFTVTKSQYSNGPGYIVIEANDNSEAREKMYNLFGTRWAFQYDDITLIHKLDMKCLARIF